MSQQLETELHNSIRNLFTLAVKTGGSDIHIKPFAPPKIRLHGELVVVNRQGNPAPPLTAEDTYTMVLSTMSKDERSQFLTNKELDYAITIKDVGRFRVNAYFSRGAVGLVARLINPEPLPLPKLGMPEIVTEIASELNGLILVTGATGSGKSTTLAAMVDYINERRAVNIVTIEDPIECLFTDKKASIIQREVHSDTHSFNNALRASLREDPDVILVGEMRDRETVETALFAAETGHLVMATLHTNSASETISRLLDFFPHEEREMMRASLSSNLRAILSQRLVQAVGGGRQSVVEILINRKRIPEAIYNPDKYDLYTLISEGRADGMQTFEDHLIDLVIEGKITKDTALTNSTRRRNLELRLNKAVSMNKPIRN